MPPPTLTAESYLCKCEDRLVTALAQSAEFQDFVGAANESEARDKIHVNELPSPADESKDAYTDAEYAAYWPGALLMEANDGDGGLAWSLTSTGPGYVPNIAFEIRLQKLRDVTKSNTDAHREMQDKGQMILQELIGFSGNVPEPYHATSARASSPWIPNPETIEGPYHMMLLSLEVVIEE